MAVKHQPKLIIAVDIDHHLIKTAIDNMQKLINDSEQMRVFSDIIKTSTSAEDAEMHESEEERLRAEKEAKMRKLLERVEQLPRSLQLAIQGELNLLTSDPSKFLKAIRREGSKAEISQKDFKNYIYGKVCFRVENYIATTNVQEKFDVIFCLSTIKYIHLTFGDLGLKTLFLKAHTQLEDDGLLILDP